MSWAAVAILAFVTAERLLELWLSSRHTKRLLADGARAWRRPLPANRYLAGRLVVPSASPPRTKRWPSPADLLSISA
jgi:hypothetical protein